MTPKNIPLLLHLAESVPNIPDDKGIYGQYSHALQMCPDALYLSQNLGTGTGTTGTLGQDSDWENGD